jgi:hypothetical protein
MDICAGLVFRGVEKQRQTVPTRISKSEIEILMARFLFRIVRVAKMH